MNNLTRPNCEDRRGTMLVVVLGLLVALFVIGTAFSYITLSERRAAQNYLDRQRALDLALDGVEYSIARLRAEATQDHFESIGPSTAGRDGDSKRYDPVRFARYPLDSREPEVSWAKNKSSTEQAGMDGGTPDGVWVDFDGDGRRGGNETSFGSDKQGANFLRGVTGFHGDGLNINKTRTGKVNFVADGRYGPSGTHSELGDYFRVRAVDAASLLNINNFRTEENLGDALRILGEAIDAWLNGGEPTSNGRDNPFPTQLVDRFVEVAEDHAFGFTSKEQLRPIWSGLEDGDRLFDLAMNFITVNSWVDVKYRDYAEANMANQEDNPENLPDVRLRREGYTGLSNPTQEGWEGWPEWQPDFASGTGLAPVNINTAPLPVLVTLFANIEANSRLMFFSKEDNITAQDQLYDVATSGAAEVYQQITGTTDFGRQNNWLTDRAGVRGETFWAPSNPSAQYPSRSIFQLVPIGPISTPLGKQGQTGTQQQGATDYAWALAQEVERLRSEHPFTSWQDFDYRFCREVLLQLAEGDLRKEKRVPDIVGGGRGDLGRNTAVDRSYPSDLLPDPANVLHPANPKFSSDAAMTGSDFGWWYWKSCVDMIRAALCPSNIITRYNADYPYHMNVDRMDLTRTNGPICFSSMGIYEVVSQGEILGDTEAGGNRATSAPDDRLPLARRQVRTVVQIYEVLRHSSQQDFMRPLSSEVVTRAATTSSTPDSPETFVSHTRWNTKSGPHSVDESSNGSWERDGNSYRIEHDDSIGIGYGDDDDEITDKIKGHNEHTSASSEFGWVTMDPQDRTPFDTTRDDSANPLTFHARFNESLWGRTKKPNFDDVNVMGANSGDNNVQDAEFGHMPLTHDVPFADFVSSATPRSTEEPLKNVIDMGGREFENAASGAQTTKYSSLQPDGVYLWGGHIRPADSGDNGANQFGTRGSDRRPRLKLLRYPCGSQSKENPFEPIREQDWQFDLEDKADGVPDKSNPHYVDPINGPLDEEAARRRLGVHWEQPSSKLRGHDEHNQAAQFARGHRSNMPYYRGTVDFWIKWDLPPMGSDRDNSVVSLGEIDPASHNFSGLFGATAYGRFTESEKYYQPDESDNPRNKDADFEGMQFFVYKEPGGYLRFTRLYFSEAFGGPVSDSGIPTEVRRFGSALRRIVGTDPEDTSPRDFSGYTGTSDAAVDAGDHGFIYARTDAWVNLNTANFALESSTPLRLRPHDWHRFTLSYNSNDTVKPYTLWIDGRQISVEFYPDTADSQGQTDGFLNDGRHFPDPNIKVPETTDTSETFTILRTTTKILEINPEDRLTVGCIFRRQVDLEQDILFDKYYDVESNPDVGESEKPARPVFRFDSNLVAVANATIDDFRISSAETPEKDIDEITGNFTAKSRYPGQNFGKDVYFEHGFFPVRASDGQLHALPLRLGTISWTELRPDWDPYAAKGVSLAKAPGIRMEWAVFDTYAALTPGGDKHDFDSAAETGMIQRNSGEGVGVDDYWARGGQSLKGAVLPSGERVGIFVYRAHFEASQEIPVNNVTPYLLDVTVTLLTPPRKLSFIIEY